MTRFLWVFSAAVAGILLFILIEWLQDEAAKLTQAPLDRDNHVGTLNGDILRMVRMNPNLARRLGLI